MHRRVFSRVVVNRFPRFRSAASRLFRRQIQPVVPSPLRDYLRPDGVSAYFRPDGDSIYTAP